MIPFSFTENTGPGAARCRSPSSVSRSRWPRRREFSHPHGTTALLEGPASGTDSDIVVAPGAWSATSNASWLHTTASGAGYGLAAFTFDADSGAPRSGALTIAGQTLTVTQAGNTYVAANPVTLFASGLYGPAGMAVDAEGNVYIADTDHANQDVECHDPDG